MRQSVSASAVSVPSLQVECADDGSAEFVASLLGHAGPLGTTLPTGSEGSVDDQGVPVGDVLALPAGPSSIELVLCALGSLGAWHLSRSARKLSIDFAPEWYHAGGPQQVGHATPLDLDYDFGSPALCWLDVPVATGSLAPHPSRFVPDLIQRLRQQAHVAAAVPRGPPLNS